MSTSCRTFVLVLAVFAAGFGMVIPSARAQPASEFAPLPTRPAKPKPAKVAPVEPPAPPRVETPAPPPAVVAAPVEEPKPVEAQKETPAPPVTVEAPKPAPAPTAAEKKAHERELAKEQAKEKAKEAAIEKEKKKKAAAEKKEKAEKMAKEPPEPKVERSELKNPKLPPDDKGPRAIEFISKCLDNYDKCIAYVNERAEKIPAGDVCLQTASDQQEITEKVRKFITLRPGIHDQAANRVVTEALYVIYPCKRGAAERTAGKKK
jgi:hypothetical protein